jgi:RNA polymerase sigma factor (TIGR02999 family)
MNDSEEKAVADPFTMPKAAQKTMTELLRRWSDGESTAFDELMELAYQRLHRIAHGYACRERGGHTLQATAILHEAMLRLMDLRGLSWTDRGHFFAVSSEMMRRILVDYARQKNRLKRGGDRQRVTLLEAASLATGDRAPDLVALDDALSYLESQDPQKAKIVKLRFFAGLGGNEIARCINISPSTVQREWRRAKTWLYAELQGEVLLGH